MTAAETAGSSSLLTAFGRALGIAGLAVGAAFALMFAFAAALVVGLMIAGAAVAMRFAPKREPKDAVLDAHQTPDGWVVETGAKRKS